MWTPSSVGRTGTIHSSAVAIRWPLTCLTPSPGLHPSSPSPYQWQTLAISDSEPSRPADDHGTPCTRIRVHRRRSFRVPGHHGGFRCDLRTICRYLAGGVIGLRDQLGDPDCGRHVVEIVVKAPPSHLEHSPHRYESGSITAEECRP
jgi:hypothetical protein